MKLRAPAPEPGLQFDVVLHRLEHEFGARAELERLSYTLARRTDADGAASLAGQRGAEVLTPPPGRSPARPVHRQVAAGRHPARQARHHAGYAGGRH